MGIPALKDIKDLGPVDGGKEYDLRIIKVQEITSAKTKRNGAQFLIEVVGENNALNIFHTLWYGNDGKYTSDDEEKSNLMWRMVKDFIRAIGFDPDEENDFEDFKDHQFTAILEYDDGTTVDDDGNVSQTYAPKNVIGKVTG